MATAGYDLMAHIKSRPEMDRSDIQVVGGLRPIDVGPLKRARELEAAGLLHMTLKHPLGTNFGSALKLVG